ncbi:MAG: radical SAM protein [Elusimicrobia bacterium]|nr:radical SAM protein [Elusimicrobiota bacterium]
MPITDRIETLVFGETVASYSLVISPHATLTFDRSGRPTGFYENGLYTARGLDGHCVEKKWVWPAAGEARRHIRILSKTEQYQLRYRLMDLLNLCRDHLSDENNRPSIRRFVRGRDEEFNRDDLEAHLDFLVQGIVRAWTTDVGRFAKVWNPIGILPPDQYLSLVVQISEGCAWNKCSFCDFYAGRPSRVRTLDEIRRHVDNAESFLGPALAGRCSIFLGDANAFQAPPSVLIPVAQELADRFPHLAQAQDDGVGGLYSFADPARLAAWSAADLQVLARTGYRRAYLGVESGSDAIRRQLNKWGSAELAAEGALKLKGAGIAVGFIVLLGAGGRAGADEHVRETAALLRNANLGPGDMVYFSPLFSAPGADGTRTAQAAGREALSEEEMAAQRRSLEALVPPRGERRALYDIREFVY